MTATPYEIRVALEKKLFEALQEPFAAGKLIIVQPGQDISPDMQKIQVVHTVAPGIVQTGELGGRGGYCPRQGAYTILLSCPADDTAILADAWDISGSLEAAFFRADCAIADSHCRVMCEQPYTTNVGETPDKRLGLSVTVPWWVWAGGYEGE